MIRGDAGRVLDVDLAAWTFEFRPLRTAHPGAGLL
jgi:hypothetical protein